MLPPSVGLLLLAVVVLGTCAGLAWAILNPQGQFFMFGMLACLIVTIPIARPGYAVLGPWTLVAVIIYISCGLRGFFIALDINGRLSIDYVFLLGHGPGYFTRTSVLYVVALGLMAAGYMWRSNRNRANKAKRVLSNFRFPPMSGVAVAVLALIGFIAFVMFVQRTGGLGSGLSTKRTTINGLNLDVNYQSYGELRFLNIFSAIALWFHIARNAASESKAAHWRLLTFAYMLNAALLPIYASSRSEVGYIALVAFVVHYGIAHRLPPSRTVLRWAATGILVLAAMTGSRLASQGDNRAAASTQRAILDSVSEVLVYNRNFGDMQTTAHIIHAVPSVLPFEYGGTMTSWLVAPIPRSIWPEKPLLQSGPIIGAKVYGNERSGVPPGFVAEMYWNFGTAGVLVGSLLLGLLLAYVRDRFVPYLRGNPGISLFYGVALVRLGGYIFINGVGSAVFNLLMDLICLMAGLFFARLLATARESTVSDLSPQTGRRSSKPGIGAGEGVRPAK